MPPVNVNNIYIRKPRPDFVKMDAEAGDQNNREDVGLRYFGAVPQGPDGAAAGLAAACAGGVASVGKPRPRR